MKTILVAEDEYALLSAMDMVLSTAGYRVVTAVNGEQALHVLDKTKTDLVILDVMMPLFDGFEVLVMLRARLRMRNLPVIMMSGAYPVKKQEEHGWTKWLDKPFQFDDLLDVVQELIGPGDVPSHQHI